jgi:molybdopterin-guanine dinucleotide biosynthesis protein A
MPVVPITTCIVAGGKSSRMGEDKAFLKVGKRLLIDHAIHQARAMGGDIFIAGPKDRLKAFGRILEDEFPDAGPLAGIHAGLKRSETQLMLALALDTPFLRTEFLRVLAEEAIGSGCLVTVAATADGLHPLCAIYDVRFTAPAEDALRQGRYKIDALFTPARTRTVDVVAKGFDPAMLDNINTQEDLARAVRRAEQEGPAAG